MKHIKEFDGLRGLLALWVFATHVFELGPFSSVASRIHAYLAVDVFMILSGFVIFYLLSAGEDYRRFLTRRWFRLFPVFAACFLIALSLLKILGINDDAVFAISPNAKLTPYVLPHALMLHGVVPDQWLAHSARAILPPAWSISVEWQFYLFAPLLFAFAMRPNWKTGLGFAALLGARLLCELGRYRAATQGLDHGITFNMQAFLPLKLEFFAVGAGTYGVWHWLAERNRPLKVPRLFYALLIPVLLLVAKKNPATGIWLAFVMLVTPAYFGSAGKSTALLCRTMNLPVTQWLGKISYCVYLFHLPALVLVRLIVQRLPWNLSASTEQAVLIAAGLVATLAGSWLLHKSVEQPMIRIGKRLTASWSSRTSLPLPVGVAPVN